MEKLLLSALILAVPVLAAAQNSSNQKFSPSKGDFSIGLTVDPLAGGAFKFQPKSGDFLGKYITTIAANPDEMFHISPSSALALNMRLFLSSSTAMKFTFGFSGSRSHYKEYVSDDYAVSCNPDAQDVVTDVLNSSLNGGSATVGFEKLIGTRAFRFTFGFSVGYAIGGGELTMQYGNTIAKYNKFNPTVMPVCAKTTSSQGALNNITDAEIAKMAYVNARPIKRYNMGACQSVGLMADIGLEWLCFDRVSLGMQLSLLPFCAYFQPQTYSIYEGFSSHTGNVEAYNKLVSPGSTSFTYGLDNLGLKISLNYYL